MSSKQRVSPFQRFGQKFNETIGTAQKTVIDSELEAGCKKVDEIRDDVNRLIEKMTSTLQPDPAVRVKASLGKEGVNKYEAFSQNLAAFCSDVGDKEPLGRALTIAGDGQQNLGSYERIFHTSTDSDVLTELKTFVNQYCKTMDNERTKLKRARLDMDVTKNKIRKLVGKPEDKTDAERRLDRQVADFDAQGAVLKQHLDEFETMKERMKVALQTFIGLQKDFHTSAAEYLAEVQGKIQEL